MEEVATVAGETSERLMVWDNPKVRVIPATPQTMLNEKTAILIYGTIKLV